MGGRLGVTGGLTVWFVGLLILPSVALGGPDASPVQLARSASTAATLTAAQLRADLIAGARTRTAPRNLEPPLASASGAKPIIFRNGCHLGRTELRSKPCLYGDKTSATTVVLFGDSHAEAWFPALDRIANQHRWRLVDLTKDGCPPAEVAIAAHFRHGAPYWECTRWRNTAMSQIRTLRPALVIMTEARWLEVPEARPLAGVPTGHGSPWLDGLAAIFEFLRRSARQVIFISDVPTLGQLAPECISQHPSDVRACTTARSSAIRLPEVKHREIELATQYHIGWIDPTSWFCAPRTCPVIVRNIVLYRDNSHMVPPWAQFIAPVLGTALMKLTHPRAGQAGLH